MQYTGLMGEPDYTLVTSINANSNAITEYQS